MPDISDLNYPLVPYKPDRGPVLLVVKVLAAHKPQAQEQLVDFLYAADPSDTDLLKSILLKLDPLFERSLEAIITVATTTICVCEVCGTAYNRIGVLRDWRLRRDCYRRIAVNRGKHTQDFVTKVANKNWKMFENVFDFPRHYHQ